MWEGKPWASWVYIGKNVASGGGEVAPSSSLCPSEATAGVQHPGLGSPLHERHLCIQEWAQRGVMKVKTEAHGIEGESDRVGTVQPRKKKIWGGGVLSKWINAWWQGKEIQMELDLSTKGPDVAQPFCASVMLSVRIQPHDSTLMQKVVI